MLPQESRITTVTLPFGGKGVLGMPLALDPAPARGLVLIAHSSGSDRFSLRNSFVAKSLQCAGSATLLLDLQTEEERLAGTPFDAALLSQRLSSVADWALDQLASRPAKPSLGLFGAGDGAAVMLRLAAKRPDVRAVVCRGGDLTAAAAILPEITAPVLLVVGEDDLEILALNQALMQHLACECRLEIVPGASHLFSEPGTMEETVVLSRAWLMRHMMFDTVETLQGSI